MRCLLPLLLLLPACSTAPLPPPGHIPYSIPQARAEIEPAHFTTGSTMEQVAAIMGTPDHTQTIGQDATWRYGFSSVSFLGGKVKDWSNISGNLRVKWSPPPPQPIQAPRQQAIKPTVKPAPVRPVAPVYYYDADDIAEIERIDMQDAIDDQEDRINQLQNSQNDFEYEQEKLKRKIRDMND